MTLPGSGLIKLSQIAAEFGGTAPHALSEYYGAAPGIPTSGLIKLTDFYGASANYSGALVSGYTTGTIRDLKGNPNGTYHYRGLSPGKVSVNQIDHSAIGSLTPVALGIAPADVVQVMTERLEYTNDVTPTRRMIVFFSPTIGAVWSTITVPGIGTFSRATGTSFASGTGAPGEGYYWDISAAQADAITNGTVEITA